MAHAAATHPTAYGALVTVGAACGALSVQDAEAATLIKLFAQVILIVRAQPLDADEEIRAAARRATTPAVEALLVRELPGSGRAPAQLQAPPG